MKRACSGLLVALAVAMLADTADAQCRRHDGCRRQARSHAGSYYGGLPFSIEGRLDAGIPVGDDSEDLDVGLGWGVNAAFELTPTFAIYGGYSRFDFEIEDTDVEVEEEGWEVGGRVGGFGGGVVDPYIQFGALFHDDETGFEVGLGGDYGVGSNLAVTPMVRYRNIDEFQYVTAGLGLKIRL